MAEPNWGLLEKSQVDDETIEEAIDRLIDAHLADINAHIESGQSLYAHKSASTVDHPADSIVTDKIPDNSIPHDKLYFDFYIVSTDEAGLNQSISSGNSITGNLYKSAFQIQSLEDENLCYIYSSFGSLESDWSAENIVFEVVAQRMGTATDDVFWTLGVGDQDLVGDKTYPQFGFYFNCSDGKIYAFYWSSGGLVTEAVKTSANNLWVKYKVTMSDDTLKWYIDDSLVKTIANPVFDSPDGAKIFVGSDYNVDGTAQTFNVRSILYSQDQKY